MLLKLLETSRESRTLAVGASDLGKFISAHPHGRSIVTGEGIVFSLKGKYCQALADTWLRPVHQVALPATTIKTWAIHTGNSGLHETEGLLHHC